MQVRTVVNDEMSSRSVWRRVRRAVKTSFSATYLQNLPPSIKKTCLLAGGFRR